LFPSTVCKSKLGKEKEVRHLIQEYGDGGLGGFFIAPQGHGDLSPEEQGK